MSPPTEQPATKSLRQRLSILVCLVLAAALVFAALMIFRFTGAANLIEGQVTLRTFVPNAAGLRVNASVRLNGILIGHIKLVELSGSRDPRRAVEVDLMFPRRYLDQIPEDSGAGITASNLLGDNYIDISRGVSLRKVKEDGEIGWHPSQDIPSLFNQGSGLMTTVQSLLARIEELLDGVRLGQDNAGMFFNNPALGQSFDAISAEVDQQMQEVKTANGVMGHFDDLSADLQKPLDRLTAIRAGIDKMPDYGQAVDQAGDAGKDAQAAIDEAQKMLDDFNAGHGTAGKLLNGDEIQTRLTEIGKKIELATSRIDSGEGAIGQFMANPAFRDSLDRISKQFDEAMKAYSAHPGKFRTFRLTFF